MSKWLPRRLRLFYRKAFREHLLLTNTVAAVLIGGCGDYLEQRLERVKPNDWQRTGRFCALGLVFGPLEHTWYMLLDRLWPGTSHKAVIVKVLVDEFIFTPPLYCIFYPGLALLEGKSRREALQELRAKFWPTLKVDILVWPAVQLINFYYVPSKLRVIYINLVQVCWTVFLSRMKHKPL